MCGFSPLGGFYCILEKCQSKLKCMFTQTELVLLYYVCKNVFKVEK